MKREVDVVSIMREIQDRADIKFKNENHGYRYEMILDTFEEKKVESVESKPRNGYKVIKLSSLICFEGEKLVEECYKSILLREPDKEGLTNNLKYLEKTSKEQLVKVLANSEEAISKKTVVIGFGEIEERELLKYEGQEFVYRVYFSVLRREPDAQGLDTFMKALATGEMSKEAIIESIANSEEAKKIGVKVLKASRKRNVVNKVKRVIKKTLTPKKYKYVNKAELRTIENEVSGLNTQLDNIKGLLESKNNQLDNIKGLLESKDNQIEELEKKISLVESVADNNRKDIEENHTELSKNEEAINILSSQYEGITKTIEQYIDKNELNKENVDANIGAVARQTMLSKWMIIDYIRKTTEKDDDVLECKICGAKHKRCEYETKESDCIFNGGHLTRYVCPDCGVIFGPSKFVNQGQSGIDEDYWVHYLGFSEGDSSYKEERAFRLLNPDKRKIYLNYGCGKWSKTLQKLREEGYIVYGYEPYASEIDNPYLITRKEDLLKMRFDGIFSNDVLEHFIDPVQELKMMQSLLVDEHSRMSHCTSCYAYKYEYTRFHTHFFVGDSVKVLAEKAGLIIENCVNDLENNDFYCYIYAPKAVNHSMLGDMYVNDNAKIKDGNAILSNNGILYGPYYNLGSGKYTIKTSVGGDAGNTRFKVTSNSGNVILQEGNLEMGENNIEVSIPNEQSGIEFTINNLSNGVVTISDLTLSKIGLLEE